MLGLKTNNKMSVKKSDYVRPSIKVLTFGLGVLVGLDGPGINDDSAAPYDPAYVKGLSVQDDDNYFVDSWAKKANPWDDE